MALFLVVSEMNREPVTDTAESCGLHLPVLDRVAIETDTIIEAPLHTKATRAEVVYVYLAYVVGMEVEHLQRRTHTNLSVYQVHLRCIHRF